MSQKPRVYFLGSADIAVASLARLMKSDSVELVGVGSQADRPAGRGKKLQATPVSKFAQDSGWEVAKPNSVNNEDFLDCLRALKIDFLLVVAYGQLLREAVLNLPKIACLNVHASILPKYRGASPIQQAILNGDAKTGVTIMQMEKGLDTGPAYCVHEMDLDDKICADELERKLADLAAEFIEEDLKQIFTGDLAPVPQCSAEATHCGKILKYDGLISWEEPATVIARKARAYHPWPGVKVTFRTERGERLVSLNEVSVYSEEEAVGSEIPAGTVRQAKKQLAILCGDGKVLQINSLTPQGKKTMPASSFLSGSPIAEGSQQ